MLQGDVDLSSQVQLAAASWGSRDSGGSSWPAGECWRSRRGPQLMLRLFPLACSTSSLSFNSLLSVMPPSEERTGGNQSLQSFSQQHQIPWWALQPKGFQQCCHSNIYQKTFRQLRRGILGAPVWSGQSFRQLTGNVHTKDTHGFLLHQMRLWRMEKPSSRVSIKLRNTLELQQRNWLPVKKPAMTQLDTPSALQHPQSSLTKHRSPSTEGLLPAATWLHKKKTSNQTKHT